MASSSSQLSEQVASGTFREDLYFQLKVVALELPPLRERRDDIEELARSFLNHVSRDYGRPAPEIDSAFLNWMRQYDWPGNVREMRNLLERCLILSSSQQKTLGLGDLPEDLAVSRAEASDDDVLSEGLKTTHLEGPLRDLRSRFEILVLRQRLDQFGGNITKAAESLGIERANSNSTEWGPHEFSTRSRSRFGFRES